MVHVGMHAAVGKKSEEVEASASTACVLHGCQQCRVGEKLAIPNHQFDTRAVHVDDTAGADIKMSHFTVAHLTVGQPNVFPAGMDKRVGIFAEQAIVGRLAGQRDGVGFSFGSIAPAVENDEDQWVGTRHLAAIGYPALLATSASCRALLPSSSFAFGPSLHPFVFAYVRRKAAWIPRSSPAFPGVASGPWETSRKRSSR